MPGYIIHLTEATLVCNKLIQHGAGLSDDWINRFLLGNLLPDTKCKGEKRTSHFWNPGELDRQAIAPDLRRFSAKYGDMFQTPELLGYHMHLDLDERYVNQFWDSILEFHDRAGRRTVYSREASSVYLKVSGLEVPVEEFFSSAYYYGDYTRSNGYFLNKYKIRIPVYEEGLTGVPEEVEPSDLRQVLQELQVLVEASDTGGIPELKVFSLPELEQFVEMMARTEYRKLMKK